MFCSNCGKEVNDEAKFCSKCGHNLTETTNSNKSKYLLIKTTNILRWWLGITIMLAGGIIAGNPIALLFGGIILPIEIKYMNKKVRFITAFILFVCMVSLNDIYDDTATSNNVVNKTILQPKIITKKEQKNKPTNDIVNHSDEKNTNKQNIPITDKIEEAKDAIKKDNITNREKDENKDKKQDSSMLSNEKLPPLPKKIDVKLNMSDNKKNVSYDSSALWSIPTQKGKGYDKVINKYGINGVKKINGLLPKAAEIISKSSECDKLSYVTYSDRGTPKNIVIFGGCNNGKRFYLSETDIKNKISAVSNKTKFEQMRYQLEDA